MSHIIVNGERRELEGLELLTDLLTKLKLNQTYLAVAINDRVIPRSEHPLTRVREGDRIEVIHAVGGG
ncbi:MAG: thiamine biosynthesis protein ThiS [Deltaproteobacteria bacterium CG11_big_fil_rev_8_21_14_0_20_49_13]|nr:MAG: thiamine biosynthesis protein ThiS [Deltaproteobacteria bacterium CG11_big_fil_rev_8_21_14_0_20_49_13]